jgi:stage II sporulation protein D
MKNKLLFLIIVIELFSLVLIKPIKNKVYRYSTNVFKSSNLNSEKLENYVIGVVAAEMPASFSFEALKAQAVAARTFAYNKISNNILNYDELVNDKGQAYISVDEMKDKWKDSFTNNYDKISEAVLDTKGEIITYNDKPIMSYYFSVSNGKTEESANVFNNQPYLLSVDSSWDVNSKEYEKDKYMSKEEILKKLGINENDLRISNIEHNSSNRIKSININGILYSGIDIRKKLGLRSTDFTFNLEENQVRIKTNGYGHGVGMSQYGANYLANQGKNYTEIIKYYYNGVNIKKL